MSIEFRFSGYWKFETLSDTEYKSIRLRIYQGDVLSQCVQRNPKRVYVRLRLPFVSFAFIHRHTHTHTCSNHCVWPVVLLTRIQCIRNRWIVVLLNAQTALLDGTQCSYGHEWVWVFLLPTADVSFAALHFVPLVWFKRIFLEHFTTSAISSSSSFFLGIKCIASHWFRFYFCNT